MRRSQIMLHRAVRHGVALASVLALSAPAMSQPEYQEYTPAVTRRVYFTVAFDKSNLRITVPTPSGHEEILVGRNTISAASGAVKSAAMVLFDARGLIFHDSVYPFQSISDIAISRDTRVTEIKFFTSERAGSPGSVLRRGNRITFDQDIDIAKDDFARGVVFTVKGNVRVAGETNKDVVSLFGDITVAPLAVVRGNLASIAGTITVAKNSTIYGDSYSGSRKSWIRRHRMYRGEEELGVLPRISYNRVDGLVPYLTVKYQDHDTTLPTAWGMIGYAFTSTHLRFELGMEQRLTRTWGLTAGAKYGRRLASADDWLIGDGENTAFALLVTEDFKDFYESDGGSVYVKATPLKKTMAEIGFVSEQTGWLDAHRNLWSLFGGDKRFPDNFGTVAPTVRLSGINEMDTTTNAYLSVRVEYNGTNKENLFGRSAWRAWGTLEWSDSTLGSDLSYRRYIAQVRRYQKATKQTALLLTGTYGASDGYLPMNRLFFLGGPGTLYGFKNKEYTGTRFWMTNAEYRFAIPRRDVAFSLFWDCGQIANGAGFSGDSEVKHSLGVAAYVGRSLRVSVSRRLDRSSDNGPEIYVRLADIY